MMYFSNVNLISKIKTTFCAFCYHFVIIIQGRMSKKISNKYFLSNKIFRAFWSKRKIFWGFHLSIFHFGHVQNGFFFSKFSKKLSFFSILIFKFLSKNKTRTRKKYEIFMLLKNNTTYNGLTRENDAKKLSLSCW